MASIGFIGGSGLYNIPEMKVLEERLVKTPWGDPSDKLIFGSLKGVDVVFLPRHGRGHRITPTEVNSRANIWALKSVGVREIVAFSAVGSLREEIAPLHFVVPSQIIDRTSRRPSTFFEGGVVAHVSFAEPFCTRLEGQVRQALKGCDLKHHVDTTLVVMEGPAFSTKAESKLYRSWGADIINMSALPESKLAREAGICYQMVCMSTDYDCWRDVGEHVTAEMIISNLSRNAENARKVILDLVGRMGAKRSCTCSEAGRSAILTDKKLWPAEVAERLAVIVGKGA